MEQVVLKKQYEDNGIDFKRFFKTERIKIFRIKEDEEVSRKEEGNKRIMIIERKIRLEPSIFNEQDREYLILFNNNYYLLIIKKRERDLYEPEKGFYYQYKLKKLISNFNTDRLKERKRREENSDKIFAPKEDILLEIIIDYFPNSKAYLKKKGEKDILADQLFKDFINFINQLTPIIF